MKPGGAARALTPALARERARMGTLRSPSVGRAIGALATSPQFPPITAAQITASLPASAQTAFQQQLDSYDAGDVAQSGASAALSLAQSGFSSAAIVHAYAGAVATVPVVGWVMAGLAEFVYANQAAIGDAINKLFAGLGVTGCHPDSRSYAQWLQASNIPTPKAGSFASVALPLLVQAFADKMVCNDTAHGMNYAFARSQIIPAAVQAWNAISQGPPVDYFVPSLVSTSEPLSPLQGMSLGQNWGTLLYKNAQGPYAFQPLASVPASVLSGFGPEGVTWERVSANAGPLTPARHVTLTLHLGPPATTTAAAAKAPAPASSTGAVVAGVAAVGAAALWVAWSKGLLRAVLR